MSLPRRTAHRLYTLLLVLYQCWLRIEAALGARIENLGYDADLHVLDVEVKGGYWVKKAVPPLAWDASHTLIGDRTEGYIFCTSTRTKLDEPSQWRAIRSVARRAGLPQKKIGPHSVKHSTITHALARPGARRDKVQHWADHKDSRTTDRYNRRRGILDGSLPTRPPQASPKVSPLSAGQLPHKGMGSQSGMPDGILKPWQTPASRSTTPPGTDSRPWPMVRACP